MNEIKGKAFSGIKLRRQKHPFKYSLIFWCYDGLSEDIIFNSEEECNKILKDICDGKGVHLEYDYKQKEIHTFPRRVIKAKIISEYGIAGEDFYKKNLTYPHLGHNDKQPELKEE